MSRFTTTGRRTAALAVLAWFPLAVAAGAGPDGALLTLGGQQFEGELLTLTPDTVELRTASSTRSIPVDDAHWLRFSVSQNSLADEGIGCIELVNGSRLPTAGVTLANGEVTAALTPPLSTQGGQPLRTDFEQVASIVFQVGSPDLREQWGRIRQTDATADLIVVKRRDGATLDSVEGIVTAISDESVAVDLDGELISVDRRRVYGVVCFRPQAQEDPRLVRVIARRGELHATRVELRETRLRVELPEGAELSAPIDEVDAIDYSRGGVRSLSDLEPMSAEWTPFFQPPGDLGLLEEWGRVRRDSSYSGKPITLRGPNGDLLTFAKGIAIRSRGEVSYAVPAGFSWLRATAGLDPAPRVRSNAVLKVLADGREVFTQGFRSGDPPIELQLPIAGVGAVTLVVDYGGNADAGDNLHLGNARFTK
ncbi:NPCBM/NEW2 domain protein [Posidoniimonas corsicana]|uniref:NPCBM/NEW2 domain protein n=1 Tax=Posidoniimonas corsicana TaxID=1938618 RepID=A0A5C5VC73_9BACT|nr:NPCBM/NEW2 domain-containing protein [Posidoniimonas corsicana]TWT35563.1 NPCBM/NEW2 domain protein [Posidoniimonas corsicana]